MAVPKRKISKTRKNNRRSHHALSTVSLSKCPQCSQKVTPHKVCSFCGYYKGKQVVKVDQD